MIAGKTETWIGEPGKRSWKVLIVVLAGGLAGVASMMLMPLERLLPEEIDLPRAVLLIQPAVLVTLFALAGWWAAPKAGLGAPVIREAVSEGNWLAPLMSGIPQAILGGALCSLILVAYAWYTADLTAAAAQGFEQPLLTKVLYGGIAEEVMMRWGLLSLMAVLALKIGLKHPAALATANLFAAVIFALGHFGALYGLVENPPTSLVVAVFVGNLLPGLVFGWLYIRKGLESAVMAHGLTHVFSTAVLALVAV